ncbi:MAG: EamA family transporter [Patulibacter sp.]
MALLLALLSAAAYGTSDYVGGLASSRAPAWQVAVVVMLTATVLSIPVSLVAGGTPTAHDWLLGSAGGAASGVGAGFLYRGLAHGRMTVVAPLSGVIAAVIPVIVGLATGDHPAPLALVGIACAGPAIVLVAGGGAEQTASGDRPAERDRAAILDGVLAGVGFGMLFTTTGLLSDSAGLRVLPALDGAGLLGVIAVASLQGQAWLPRERAAWRGWPSGLLGLGAVACVTLAYRHGLMSVVSVIASLYPAVTVVLAALLLGERIGRAQAIGLLLAAASVALVATG